MQSPVISSTVKLIVRGVTVIQCASKNREIGKKEKERGRQGEERPKRWSEREERGTREGERENDRKIHRAASALPGYRAASSADLPSSPRPLASWSLRPTVEEGRAQKVR